MLKHKVEAVSTFDVSIVEADNLCELEYTLVIMCTHGTLNPLTKYKRYSLHQRRTAYMCRDVIDTSTEIWTSCSQPIHNKAEGVRLRFMCQWKQEE